MATKLRTHDPLAFTRAAHDELVDIELNHGVSVEVVLEPTNQKGVWTIRAASQPIFTDMRHLKHSMSNTWPNAHAESFEACLYQTLYKLARMLEFAVRSHETNPPPKGR